MKKKNIIEAMIPFITNMMGGKVKEEKEDEEPLVFEITSCHKISNSTYIKFTFGGEGISKKLNALSPKAEFWAYGEDDDVLVGEEQLSFELSEQGESLLVTKTMSPESRFNSANYTKVFIENYTTKLDIDGGK